MQSGGNSRNIKKIKIQKSSGTKFRSRDLWVMSPARYPLRHSAVCVFDFPKRHDARLMRGMSSFQSGIFDLRLKTREKR